MTVLGASRQLQHAHAEYDEARRKRIKVAQDPRQDESGDPLEDSGCTQTAASDEECDIDDLVIEDMQRLERSFRGFSRKYRLINRIGEGTFSTVYKAVDLMYSHYQNEWDLPTERPLFSPSGRQIRQDRRKAHYVAIKKIYVTSSPARIMNELELLHDLRGCEAICPLITAFRDKDQVIAILPFFHHLDFRTYFRDMRVPDMRHYFRSLFTALAHVHACNILHRDIKPTNFLYDPLTKQGVLVDFGLAEREGTDYQPCLCQLDREQRTYKIAHSYHQIHQDHPHLAVPRQDTRPSLRANRAGTRGFRAPEVLFKCTNQSTQIDIWSAGVILLTFLSRRFPFFNSADDVEAVVELTTVFGKDKMKKAALLHGQVLDTNIPTISDAGYTLEKIILWSTRTRTKDKLGNKYKLTGEESVAVDFLSHLFEIVPKHRISAADALKHPFLSLSKDEGSEDEMDVLHMSSPR